MFYERLNALCKAHGTNITELAITHLDLASSAPSAWKRGAEPRIGVVIRAAQFFGVTTDYLLGLSDDPLSSAPHDSLTVEEQAIQAVAARMRQAAPKVRQAALAAANAILDALDQ